MDHPTPAQLFNKVDHFSSLKEVIICMYSGTKIAKASHLRPYTREDSPLIEGKGAHPITQIALIQRRKKCYPLEEKGTLP